MGFSNWCEQDGALSQSDSDLEIVSQSQAGFKASVSNLASGNIIFEIIMSFENSLLLGLVRKNISTGDIYDRLTVIS